jgi:predicted transcriptional regulator
MDRVALQRAIEEAIAEAERGAKVSHEKVGPWLLSLGNGKPLPMPLSSPVGG